MSLFKTYPPSQLTLDLLCSMSPRNVLEYIKDMHQAQERRVQSLKESLKDFILENHELQEKIESMKKSSLQYVESITEMNFEEINSLKQENIRLHDELGEELEQNAQTVRDLNETIEGLREEIAILQQDAKEDKELRRLALEVCNGIDQGSCRLDHDTQEAYEELCALREELYGVPAEEAPVEEAPVTPEQAWACFKDSKESFWKECFSECNENGFHPHTIQFSEWYVRDLEYGDIVAQGEGKPKKATIQEHHATGIWIRLYAFNKREEIGIITWFDGKEWVFEELINVD